VSEVVLIRHGETEWSASGKHTGVTDVPLTDNGREAARRAGEALAELAFALVLTSPRQRARDTAALAGFPDAVADEDLVELDYGEYEGITTAEIRETRPGWDVWRDGSPGGESLADAAVRADRVIERALGADGDVLIVAHGHLLRVLAARWIELPPEGGGRLALGTAAACTLGFERERRVIWRWNDQAASASSSSSGA